jgi:hypothetical protein
MRNRLAGEKSPYLLQHADNPVDWYPWGEEAFRRARNENKPVFLSVGYATCHWCHVMAHESFEDPEVAEILNRHFVSVKVDREERPDVDGVYMAICQAMTGSGGWPLTVFMTPGGEPFFAGTYFPRTGRLGMPGFVEILNEVARRWHNEHERVLVHAGKVAEAVRSRLQGRGESRGSLTLETLDEAYRQLLSAFDRTWGGFGSAPKFPTPHNLTFLLRYQHRSGEAEALRMVSQTLNAMRNGGIFDQIGYGFHRYSVDERWRVPHFEKMLYDQALLAMAAVEAHQTSGEALFARIAREIFTYVLRDMTDEGGGFYSAEDADSEGREGRFYVWTPEQVREVLGEDRAALFCDFYGITPEGNFEDGFSIPHVRMPLERFAARVGMEPGILAGELEVSRRELFEARKRREHPLKDDKILTSWNGLMIAALAKGYQAFGDETHLRAAERSAEFVLETLAEPDGRLHRRYREGHVARGGYLDDYTFLVWGLLELYEASFELRYLEAAARIHERTMELFWDQRDGGFFLTPSDGERLIARGKEIYDGALPSGNSVGVLNLLRLARMTGRTDWEESAEQAFRYFSGTVAGFPMAYTQFLNALDFAFGPSREIVLVGERNDSLLRAGVQEIHRSFLPRKVVMLKEPSDRGLAAVAPHLEGITSMDEPAVYVCEGYSCQKPLRSLHDLRLALQRVPPV